MNIFKLVMRKCDKFISNFPPYFFASFSVTIARIQTAAAAKKNCKMKKGRGDFLTLAPAKIKVIY